MENYAIIVAGGSGKRIGGDIPKQFLLLGGLPIIMHTISAFSKSNLHPKIFLVLQSDFHAYWADLCKTFQFNVAHQIVIGGPERFHSVQNVLKEISGNGLVAVHDGVRPLVSTELIDKCFSEANIQGNAVPAVVSSESVRKKTGSQSVCLNRNEIFLVQTPQVFKLQELRDSYKQSFSNHFTDDASVMEQSGKDIYLVEGERTNIKITRQLDLEFAELILKTKPTYI